jgi:bacillithiol biosynthesis cysteine-adding enzyme BshC
LCEQLAEKYSSNNFVPVFWMAIEDHDFNELNYLNLYGKRIEWSTKQNGAVGRMNIEGFESVISDLKSILGSHKNTDRLINLFEQTYLGHKNLADATRYLVDQLFGKFGLVIIDGDHKELKQRFIPQIKKDILESGFVSTIKECSTSLAKNYKAQAFIRDINFFKLSDGGRDLINTKITEREIEEKPELFSPNVLLRPLYQEVILPNIAYIGGGAELSYWMQLRTAFKQEKIPFPLLVLRNSALLINEKRKYLFEKLGFDLGDLFLSKDTLNKRYVITHSNRDISLVKDKEDLVLFYQNLALKVSDSSLQSNIKAQVQKQLSFLDGLQEKIIRIEKKKSETAIDQIAKIKKILFPNNILQERYDNFIPYYLQDENNFIEILKNNFDPLSTNFVVLILKD